MIPSADSTGELQVVGVDACPCGWVAIVLEDGRFAAASMSVELKELVQQYPEAGAFGIDMPLGLLEAGWR